MKNPALACAVITFFSHALPLYADAPSSPPQASIVREQNRTIVENCASSLPVGFASPAINRSLSDQCRLPSAAEPNGHSYKWKVSHRFLRKADGIHLAATINIKTDPKKVSKKRAAFMTSKFRECMPELNRTWQRYGLTLDLEITDARAKETTKLKPPSDPELEPHDILVIDGTGRSDSGNIYFNSFGNKPTLAQPQGTPFEMCLFGCQALPALARASKVSCQTACEPVRQREMCVLLIHEVGHLLGLADEYKTDECPAREFTSTETYPWSAMNDQHKALFETPLTDPGQGRPLVELVEFYPRHIKKILKDVCPKIDSEPEQKATPNPVSSPTPTTQDCENCSLTEDRVPDADMPKNLIDPKLLDQLQEK